MRHLELTADRKGFAGACCRAGLTEIDPRAILVRGSVTVRVG
jgi:hypothetical protein